MLQKGARPEMIARLRTEVAVAEAAVEQARAAYGLTEVKAPFDGTVASVEARKGEYVQVGVPVVRLADFSQMRVETVDLSELDVVNIEVGQSATMTIDALPGLKLTGTVTRIDRYGQSLPSDITYRVVVTPDQSDPRLLWNMTASVGIEAE